ncbi:sulfite exporter TauE/SafE family protein [Candidatus Pacebacteria bacterium]|nr:sulfite exporter TauE/SafE family protein [Candidatus Paceibacterota bacterium]
MEILLVFILGILVSLLSSIAVGSLAILSLSGLLALGYAPLSAIGIFKLGGVGFSIGGLIQYFKAKKIVWSLLPPLIATGSAGAIIGTFIIISIDESVIEKIIGFAILLFIPLSIWKPKLGTEHTVVSKGKRLAGHIAYFFTSIWAGSVSIGTGFMVMYSQMYLYGLTILEVKGTNRIPNLLTKAFSVPIFAYYGYVNWEAGLVLALGMLIGSYIGTHYALKLGDSWLRYILLATMALFALKLLLGL